MTAVLHCPAFLDPVERVLVLDALDDDALCWRTGVELGRASAGESLQLAGATEHAKAPMRRVASLLASRLFDALADGGVTLPPPEDITPQVFPVKMYGNPDNPPRQRVHCDHSVLGRPRLTCVYYPLVQDIRGGALVLHAADETVSGRYRPATNVLVVIQGNVLHSVEPLTDGCRITVVTNLYW